MSNAVCGVSFLVNIVDSVFIVVISIVDNFVFFFTKIIVVGVTIANMIEIIPVIENIINFRFWICWYLSNKTAFVWIF